MTAIAVTEAATIAGVTPTTIRRWCRRALIAAVKVARRWTIDAASLAAKLGAKPAAPVLTADNLVALGHRRWTKNGHDRVYIQNAAALAGLEYDTYSTGNVSWGALGGDRISNAKTGELLAACSRVYFDVATGQITGASSCRVLSADTIFERITTALLAAVAA